MCFKKGDPAACLLFESCLCDNVTTWSWWECPFVNTKLHLDTFWFAGAPRRAYAPSSFSAAIDILRPSGSLSIAIQTDELR